ncbi:hepatitis A virus cellular receptor 1 homolog isoform X2 [Lagopus muta]|uniref:hepatitis A virus cellular receptor 1 homolog isoform X2 n=1 Tax=Lagopus muta TaxID=64668 RepID=UPI0020A18A8F|nr:hepatitis A virus cellular receptor 1 homolog isoform X2 [Lagopus muta]
MSSHYFLDWILLIWLAGPTVSGLLVRGEVGQNITMPCFYTVRTEHDITSVCWGRDACPPSKCSRPIIWTDGRKVTEGYHAKYVLKGNLLKGDVSLTILNAQETDSGTYCCRVEIPGWFNDKTTNLQVVVERARVSTATPLTHTSPPTSAPGSASEASFTVRTWPPVSLSEAPETASGSYSSISDYPEVTSSLQNSSISTHSQQYSEKSVYLRTGLCVGFLLILGLGLFLGRRYLRNMKKLSKFASSVAFWRPERAGNQSALEVEIHAEENIYTIH